MSRTSYIRQGAAVPLAYAFLITLMFTVGCSGETDPLEEAGHDPAQENSSSESPSTAPGSDDTNDPGTSEGDRHPSCDSANVVGEAPSHETQYIQAGFTRYAQIAAPNGGLIKIFGSPQTGDERIRRAHSLLSFYLKAVPNSAYGADKREVANRMAQNNAILVMPSGAHGEGPDVELDAQPLYEDETPVEGSAWYMQNNWEHRDAAFEEIFHLLHDTGIGTYLPGALPEYQSLLLAEAEAALSDGRWGIPTDPEVNGWIAELREEGSLAQEYIASVIDSYYGLWGPWDEADGGMWGVYIAKTRDEIVQSDPQGGSLLESFLSEWLDYEVHLAAELSGDFSMTFDASTPYTHKSQYLVHVTLTGDNPSNIFANAQDNTLRGNTASNTLDGMDGTDTAVYCENRSTYTITKTGDEVVVDGNEGRDVLRNMEVVHFADGAVLVSDL
ncbi:MAG: hypothetical protein HOK28_17255 [Deltaproteobacteria bacterium]|nr:hypothetical protein [Deltaproteobacteria bacterium]